MTSELSPVTDLVGNLLPSFLYEHSKHFTNLKCIIFGFGAEKAIVICNNGEVFSIGDNTRGCLGLGHREEVSALTKIDALTDQQVSDIKAGRYHVMARTADGMLYVWGENYKGELGIGDKKRVTSPRLCQPLATRKVSQIACGCRHSMALVDSHEVFAWGFNDRYQIGTGDTTDRPAPTPVQGLPAASIQKIDCTNKASFVLTSAGEIHCWGHNSNGEIGIGSWTDQGTPTKFGPRLDVRFKSFKCGMYHILAIDMRGKLYACGENSRGQIAVEKASNVSRPHHIDINNLQMEETGAVVFSHLSTAKTVCGKVYVWGRTKTPKDWIPMLTNFNSLRDAFRYVSKPPVTLEPIIPLGDEDECKAALVEAEAKDGLRIELERYFDNPDASDVRFVVEGRTLHGHLSFLRMRSPYLKKMLSSAWMSKEQDVVVMSHSYIVFRAYLKFLYTDQLDIDSKYGLGLLHLAVGYGETRLRKLTEDFIYQNVNIGNVLIVYEAAKKLSSKELADCCIDFAVSNKENVVKTESYKTLSQQTLLDFHQRTAGRSIAKLTLC